MTKKEEILKRLVKKFDKDMCEDYTMSTRISGITAVGLKWKKGPTETKEWLLSFLSSVVDEVREEAMKDLGSVLDIMPHGAIYEANRYDTSVIRAEMNIWGILIQETARCIEVSIRSFLPNNAPLLPGRFQGAGR